jgi:hypothetical protein
VKVFCPATFNIFRWQIAGFHQQLPCSFEKFTVKMGDVAEKVTYNAPYRFAGIGVFLTANMTEFTIELGIAVQAGFFRSFPGMRHYINFAKNTHSPV